MIGRYGMDRLGQFLNGAALAFIAVGFFSRSRIVDTAGMIVLIVCYYRIFSKNIGRRFKENQNFERIWFHTSQAIQKWRYKIQQVRKFHIYKCSECGQKIRIPRGKGKISIHCPKCGTDFIKKS